MCRVMGTATRSLPPAESLVITRHLTQSLGKQTFLPPRLLYGLMPTVLLEGFDIWQNGDDSLSGYMRQAHGGASVLNGSDRSELRVRLFRSDASRGASPQQHTLAECNAIIQRVAIHDHESSDGDLLESESDGDSSGVSTAGLAALSSVDASKPVMTLLNLLLAPAGSALRRLARLLLRLEDLSHVLVWSLGEAARDDADCSIDLVELPRLNLTFRSKVEAGSVQLYCEQHEGFFITNRRSSNVRIAKPPRPHTPILRS